MKIAFELNSAPVELQIEARETLAEVLRARCRLTGVKLSCEAQVCGACTVLVDGLPVSACTFLAYEARGKHVLTIEGLAESPEKLHPLQQAFLDNFAFQCGFCTPGMILAGKALLDENPRPTCEQIVAYMDGNLCRCTGYLAIVKSIHQVAAASAPGTEPNAGAAPEGSHEAAR